MIQLKCSNEMADRIFDELRQYNDQFEPKVGYEQITFYAEEDGVFLGGLQGAIAWDVLDISNMIVLRKKKGIGTMILKKAEEFAKQKGLTKITTWTLDFQAPDFYTKFGFEEFAVVQNYAGTHACHYFIKRI